MDTYTTRILSFHDEVAKRMTPGKTHLHVGGYDSNLLLRALPEDTDVIAFMPPDLRTRQKNVRMVRSADEVMRAIDNAPERFGSVSLTFRLHTIERSGLEEFACMMPPGTSLSVLDYNLRGKTPQEARGLLNTHAEEYLIEKAGFERVYEEFTKVGPERLCRITEGLYLQERFETTPKTFAWHGKRQFTF